VPETQKLGEERANLIVNSLAILEEHLIFSKRILKEREEYLG
jgi:hypothetical protein